MNSNQMKELIKSAKHGSPDAFGKLYFEYSRDLYRFALWYLHNGADAEDAVQEACLEAYKNIRLLRKDDAFRSWFFKILANICRDKLSLSEKSSDTLSVEASDTLVQIPDASAENFVTDGEVSELLMTLPETDRNIVIMSVLADFNSKEIGKILKLNSSTVRSRLSRSLEKLRNSLEEQESCK